MRRILALGFVACAAAALAQTPQPPPTDPALPPRYEVEILVFAHRDFDPTEERFDAAPQSFGEDHGTALREAPVFDETTLNPPVDPFTPVDPLEDARAAALRVRPLAPEELKLNNEYRK